MKVEFSKNSSIVPLIDLLLYVIGGDWGKEPEYSGDDYVLVNCIRGSEIKEWLTNKGKNASLRKIKKNSLAKRKLQEGDILIEISGGGPEQPVGRTILIDKVALSLNNDIPKICTNFLRLVRPTSKINPKYLNLYLNLFYESGEVAKYQGGSNNLRNLKFDDYVKIVVPIVPLPEQHAIVAKIEALFSELDNGIESLKKAQEQLKVFRQAVLKWAFEGKLTGEWRQSRRLNGIHNSSDEVLEKISTLQQSKKDFKINEISKSVVISDSDNLPEEWCWVELGGIIEEPKYGTSKKCIYGKKGIGVLRIPNICESIIDEADLKFAEFDEDEILNYQLKEGDLLIIRSNGSIDLVGKCSLIQRKDEKYLFAGYLIRLRPYKNIVFSKFLLYVLCSYSLRIQIESKAKSTSGVNNINSGEIKSLVLPLCHLDEQHAIVREIETRLSVCDKLEETISQSLQQAEALRQSILKKAFEGKLLTEAELQEVRKAPDWEPAEKLLERIKAEKLSVQPQIKSREKREKI